MRLEVHVTPAALAELLDGTGARLIGDSSVTVADLAYDSRDVRPGSLFFALAGEKSDGHDFIGAAVQAGAVAAVVSRESDVAQLKAQAVVGDVRRVMGPVAHRFFGDPTASISLAGITGTNGKTTTAYIVQHVMSATAAAGLLGTVEYRLGTESVPATRTTPESVDLARAFAAMRERGVTAAAMEVSSHALDQGRASGCRFDVAAFTNLSQDHLDYHETMQEYFEAKRSLFLDPAPGCVRVVNADDDAGRRLVRDGLADITYGTAADATLGFEVLDSDASGTRLRFSGLGLGSAAVRVPLVGAHNASNAACAAAICRGLDIDPDIVLERLATAPQVPGRLERIDAGQPFAVFVDYAHTPDGLESVLGGVRAVTRGRVLVVFGAGGERDRSKRPLMGRAAATLADRAIVTSDNPRGEDPDAIIEEILAGIRPVADADWLVEADRRAAIGLALGQAGPDDTVLIAGKGHESGQQVGQEMIPFDDREVARELLGARGAP